MTKEPIYCLIVDDDALILDFLQEALSSLDIKILTAKNGSQAIDTLASRAVVDILITDLNMPSVSGEELIQKTKEVSPRTLILVITGFATIPSAVSLMKQGIFEYLTKPIELSRLLGAVERSIAEVKKRQEKNPSSDIHKLWQVGQMLDKNLSSKRFLSEVVENAMKISSAEAGALWLRLGEDRWELTTSIHWSKEETESLLSQVQNDVNIWKERSQEEISAQMLSLVAYPSYSILIAPFVDDGDVVAILFIKLIKNVSGNVRGLLSVFCCQLLPIVSMSARIAKLLYDHENAIKNQSTVEKLHEDLKQSSKLAAIGELAAGIIHDINTPLTCIIGFLQLYIRFVEKPGITSQDLLNVKDYIYRALSESQRCQQIVRDLLSYSRKESKIFQPFDFQEMMDKVIKLLEDQFLKINISIQQSIPKNLPKIFGSSNQIQQVLVNLLVNAKHAIKSPPGKIQVSAEITPSKQIKITVQDNGQGIEPENLPKIFQPFFTTNAPGQGTGLGLSISKKIIKEHSGEIFVHSQWGQGTTFTIILPTVPS